MKRFCGYLGISSPHNLGSGCWGFWMVPAGLPDSTDSTDSTDTEEDRTPNSTKKLGIALSILFRYFFDTFEPWMLLILSASLGFGPTIRSIPSHLQAAFPALACAEQNPSPCDCKWTLRSVLATDLCSWLSTSPCSSLCHYAFDRDSTLA